MSQYTSSLFETQIPNLEEISSLEYLIVDIASRLDKVHGSQKSIIQADLSMLSDTIEDELFKLKISENNYKNKVFPHLDNINIKTNEAIGLLFLAYVTYNLRSKLSYGKMWPIIAEDLSKYERQTTFFKDNYLHNDHANTFLISCIENACERFQLRNAFENRENEHYIRNTILLQFGILNKFSHLNLWLSGYLNQTTLKVLLDKENEYFSNSFTQGWRVLRRYRDNVIDSSAAESLLKQNVWFKDIDIGDALRASRKKLGKMFLSEDEIENIFFVDQILYQDNLLKFIINAEDLYALKLGGNDYSVYIDGEYKAKVLRNDEKILELDKKIEIEEPEDLNVMLELKNEDGDIVYSDDIVLFDLYDQVLIFDDKGNIYRDYSKKLPANRTYTMLFDSDLDCSVPSENQIEYFSGYVTLTSDLSKNNNCLLSYDNEALFELNFTDSVEKPEWLGDLVVYTANQRLNVDEETEYNLRIFDMDDEENQLKLLPKEAKIIRWTYNGSYVDSEDISNFSASIELSPELICERKHSFIIRYKNKTYHKTVQSVIYDQTNTYHLMQCFRDGDISVVNRSSILNYDELIQSKFHLALFNYEKSKGQRIIKDKMKFYGKVDLNKKFKFPVFPKFGETVIASEHLFNDTGDILFKVVRQGIVNSYDQRSQSVIFSSMPTYFDDCEFIVLDESYNIKSLDRSDLIVRNNNIELDRDYLSMAIIYEGNYVGSFVQYDRIDFERLPNDTDVLKVLYMSYMPIIIMDKPLMLDCIQKNLMTFFHSFMSDSFDTPMKQTVYFNFDEVSTAIEHLLYDVEFTGDDAQNLLQEIILNNWSEKMLKMPILLVYLLGLVKDQKYVSYFHSLLSDIPEQVDRDDQFIKTTVENLLNHLDLNNIEKHNLKIAMQYKNKTYYLNEAFKKLQEG